MATIKAFTDLSQSKKLAEILPIESADMYYECTKEEPEYKVYVGRNIDITYNLFSYRNGHTIPCWSLAALLESIPFFITIKEEGEPDEYYHFQLNNIGSVFRSKWWASYHGLKTERGKVHTRRIRWAVGPDEESDTPLDAVFEMVCWLIEQGYMNLKCCDNEKLY